MTISNFKIFSFLLLCISISSAVAQNKAEIDTLNAFELSVPSEVIQYQLNTSQYFSNTNNFLFNTANLDDSSSVWIRTRMMVGSFSNREEDFGGAAAKMMSPMFDTYLETQKLATLRAILGSVQVGAVAYMAYKHIKKYGFLKK